MTSSLRAAPPRARRRRWRVAAARGARARPTQPLRAILPVGAGLRASTPSRAASAPSLTKALNGQAVVIENLPGAGGITGTQAHRQGDARRQHDRRRVEQPRRSTRACTRRCRSTAINDITPIMRGRRDAAGARRQPDQAAGRRTRRSSSRAQGQAGRVQLRVVGQRDDPPSRRARCSSTQTGTDAATTSRTRASGRWSTDIMGGQVDWGVVAAAGGAGASQAGRRCARSASAPRSACPPRPTSPTMAEQGVPGLLRRRLVRRDRPGQAAAGASEAPARRDRARRSPRPTCRKRWPSRRT